MRTSRPEGEDTELLHDMKFAGLVKVEDVRKQARISIKIKLLLLYVIVIAHLRGGEVGLKTNFKKDEKEEWKMDKSHKRELIHAIMFHLQVLYIK